MPDYSAEGERDTVYHGFMFSVVSRERSCGEKDAVRVFSFLRKHESNCRFHKTRERNNGELRGHSADRGRQKSIP